LKLQKNKNRKKDSLKNSTKIRYGILGGILLVCMGVFTYRLVDWQLINGQTYLEAADKTYVSTVNLTAARGEIVDTNGKPLAANKTEYNIVLDATYLNSANRSEVIDKLIQLMKQRNEPWVDELPITINQNGQYEFIADKEAEISELKGKNFLNLNTYATADMCMQQLTELYDITGYSQEDTRNICSVRYNMTRMIFSISNPYTFAENISKDTAAIIQERSADLAGVTV